MESTLGDLIFIGDAHLERDDPQLGAFLAFLDSLLATAERIVFVGDLFNLWIGRPELEQSHHAAVLSKLVELRRQGIVLRYLEGNRDFRIGPPHAGTAFDDVSSTGIEERFGGRRIFAIHGDLANPADRQYRLWRRVSRSAALWALFHRLPAGQRMRLAESAENRMRASNREFKKAFPEPAVLAYARAFLSEGRDAVVLGHFHVERDLRVVPPDPAGRVLVLPEWKGSRRHLRVSSAGEIAFVDSAS